MTTTATRERPIIFTPEMVRAILDGRKTQTRRVVKPQPRSSAVHGGGVLHVWGDGADAKCGADLFEIMPKWCPYGAPGDLLWVRHEWWHYTPPSTNPDNEHAWDPITRAVRWPSGEVVADCEPELKHWRKRPSIHMPRWASRLTLRVTDVRVQRVQEISEANAFAEGVQKTGLHHELYTPISHFRDLWNGINAARGFGWDANPWVWAVTFEIAEAAR